MTENNKICIICDTNYNSKNLNCGICSKSICMECCFSLSSKKTSVISMENVFIKYECPFCRYNNKFNIEIFDKDELLKIYKNNLKAYIGVINDYNVSMKEKTDLENDINNLKLMNEMHERHIDKISTSLKQVIDINRNNTKNYDLIINQYKKYVHY